MLGCVTGVRQSTTSYATGPLTTPPQQLYPVPRQNRQEGQPIRNQRHNLKPPIPHRLLSTLSLRAELKPKAHFKGRQTHHLIDWGEAREERLLIAQLWLGPFLTSAGRLINTNLTSSPKPHHTEATIIQTVTLTSKVKFNLRIHLTLVSLLLSLRYRV